MFVVQQAIAALIVASAVIAGIVACAIVVASSVRSGPRLQELAPRSRRSTELARRATDPTVLAARNAPQPDRQAPARSRGRVLRPRPSGSPATPRAHA